MWWLKNKTKKGFLNFISHIRVLLDVSKQTTEWFSVTSSDLHFDCAAPSSAKTNRAEVCGVLCSQEDKLHLFHITSQSEGT